MKSRHVVPFAAILLVAGCAGDTAPRPGGDRRASFRVRSDFTAPLNADAGWAGTVNEPVTVHADQPFRVRFEIEPSPREPGRPPYRLQYRRNAGEWIDVEAHDFPHPERAVTVDFARASADAPLPGWALARGDPGDLAVVPDGPRNILRVRPGAQPLVALYMPPWEPREFGLAAELRLPAGSSGAGLVFARTDDANYCRVLLDPKAGAIRVSRFTGGNEQIITERKAGNLVERWLEIEIEFAGETLEVSIEDEDLEFTVPMGAGVPVSALGFQVPPNGRAEFRQLDVEGEAKTPRLSIVACPAYENGAATTDLLTGSSAPFGAGAGVSLAEHVTTSTEAGTHSEFEWPLVVRRFGDDAVVNDEGDTFELRMIDGTGAVPGQRRPVVTVSIPAQHLGGTFVETPGRIGPWRAANGDLYFIIEPAETSNLFMMVKSSDNGRTWQEVDGPHRPETNDLEAVDARQVGDTIHIIHQVTRSLRYHSFRTSDHPAQPDTWHIRDERAAEAASIAQAATMAVRSDGSIVAFHVGETVRYNIRSPQGRWGRDTEMDPGVASKSAGPRAVLGANDTVHVAYYGMDGTVWYRRLERDGRLTPRVQLASGLGRARAEFGAVLPLLFIPATNTVVIIYRQADGRLWERRVIDEGAPTPPVRVTDRNVVQDAVDSQQPGADAVLDGETVRVLFIEEASGSIFSTHDRGGWQPSRLEVSGIRGAWVRGNVYVRKDGRKVYGYVYDAGSDGGSGMNRFSELVVP